LFLYLQERGYASILDDSRSVSTAVGFASAFLSDFFLPHSIQLEVTTKCNLKCKTCLRSDEPNSDMPLKLFKSVVDQFRGPRCRSAILQGLGEPLLNPNILPMVRYAKSRSLNVGFVSNLTLMNRAIARSLIECQLDWLAASFDSSSRRTFERIRQGANFEEISSNLRTLIAAKRELNSRKPRVRLNVTLSGDNDGEIRELARIAGSFGADSISFTPQLGLEANIARVRYVKAVDMFRSMHFQGLMYRTRINSPLFSSRAGICMGVGRCYVTYDGKVMPCGMLIETIPRNQYERVQIGDLTTQSLSNVWFSRKHRNLRFDRVIGRFSDYCQSCPSKLSKERENKMETTLNA